MCSQKSTHFHAFTSYSWTLDSKEQVQINIPPNVSSAPSLRCGEQMLDVLKQKEKTRLMKAVQREKESEKEEEGG